MSSIAFSSSVKFLFLAFFATACITTKKLETSLDQMRIDIGVSSTSSKSFPSISIPRGVEIDSVFCSSGFPTESTCKRAGTLILPLVIYNRFQTNHLITLGENQFEFPLNDAIRERISVLLSACQDSTRFAKNNQYNLDIDIKSCIVQGVIAHGSWYAPYSTGIIDYVDASTFFRINWILSEGNKSLKIGNITVSIKDPNNGPITGFLVNTGERKVFSEKELTYGMPFQVQSGDDLTLNSIHVNKMAQIMCLTFDKAIEILLRDIELYFNEME